MTRRLAHEPYDNSVWWVAQEATETASAPNPPPAPCALWVRRQRKEILIARLRATRQLCKVLTQVFTTLPTAAKASWVSITQTSTPTSQPASRYSFEATFNFASCLGSNITCQSPDVSWYEMVYVRSRCPYDAAECTPFGRYERYST